MVVYGQKGSEYPPVEEETKEPTPKEENKHGW